jgi:hypothetical protein
MDKRKVILGSGIIIAIVLTLGLVILSNRKPVAPEPVKPGGLSSEIAPTTRPQAKNLIDPNFSIKVFGTMENPIYVFRLFTVGLLVSKDGKATGAGYFAWDDKKMQTRFDLNGKNNAYIIGLCTAATLCDFANELATYSFTDLSARIPHGTLIQLKVSPDSLPESEKRLLEAAVDAGFEGKWQFKDIILHAFEIDIVKK